jgi:predicted secreted protein
MAATLPAIGKGTIVRVGRGAGPTWTTLARVGDVTFPQAEAEDIDVTAQDSPGNALEFIAGLTDNGTVEIPTQYLPDSPTDVLLRALQLSGEAVQLEITPVNGTAEKWAAYVKAYGRSAPVKGVRQATAMFKISGTI